MSTPLFMPRPVRLQCPSCGLPINVEMHTIIDAGRQPEMKDQLLEGRLNVAACAACRHRSAMSAPLLYHDGDKEFLGVFMPAQAEMSEIDRQKIIGEMTTTLMNSLPPQQRKGYLFQAKQFLTLPSLLNAILLADGITPEQLDAQRAQLRLVQQLLDAQGADDVLETIVKEHDEQLDYGFFALLSAMAERARKDGEEAEASRMLALRDKLLDMTSWGKEAKPERKVLERLGGISTHEQLVDRLVEAADEGELEEFVPLARPLLDYAFFQTLTARMESAEKEEANRLRILRSRLLDLTDKLDKEMEKEAERAGKLIRTLLASPDLRAAVHEHREEISDMVLAVLSMNLQEAERVEASEVVDRLRSVWKAITEMIEESMPPEVRFINRLMDVEFPEGTHAILEDNQDQVSGALLQAMQSIADDLERQGQLETAKRLRDIRGQTVLMA